jgi:nuclear migration protein JNM1
LVDVRGRLEKIRKAKQGRGKLVGVVLGEHDGQGIYEADGLSLAEPKARDSSLTRVDDKPRKSDARSVVEMDRRVGELENILGSSSVTLDEVSGSSPTSFQSYLLFLNIDVPITTAITSSHNATQHPVDSAYTTASY